MSSAEVRADRERVRSIIELPEAVGFEKAAAMIAVHGASLAEAKAALTLLRPAQSSEAPDFVARMKERHGVS